MSQRDPRRPQGRWCPRGNAWQPTPSPPEVAAPPRPCWVVASERPEEPRRQDTVLAWGLRLGEGFLNDPCSLCPNCQRRLLRSMSWVRPHLQTCSFCGQPHDGQAAPNLYPSGCSPPKAEASEQEPPNSISRVSQKRVAPWRPAHSNGALAVSSQRTPSSGDTGPDARCTQRVDSC